MAASPGSEARTPRVVPGALALAAALAVLLLGGCVPQPGSVAPTALRPAAAATAAAVGARDQGALLPVEDAVTRAAEALFANARLPQPPPDPSGRYPVVIDPLIDAPAASQSTSTRLVQARVAEVARRSPRYELRPFNTASLDEKPLVLLGTLAPLRPGNAAVGAPTAYNLWLVLADLRTGRIVGRSEVAMRVEGVDPTPTAFFRDSPVWVRNDPAQQGYVATCGARSATRSTPATSKRSMRRRWWPTPSPPTTPGGPGKRSHCTNAPRSCPRAATNCASTTASTSPTGRSAAGGRRRRRFPGSWTSACAGANSR